MKLRTLLTILLTLALNAFADIKGLLSFAQAGTVTTAQMGYKGKLYNVTRGVYSIPVDDPSSIKVKPHNPSLTLNREYDLFGRKIQPQSWATQFTSIKQYAPTQTPLARSASLTDTLYIVVQGDTLKEIPITSWNQILPTLYIVQRNVQMNVKSDYFSDTAQIVWWNNDSIAHVLSLQQNSPNSGSFSGYIYTIYNDNEFANNAHLYNLFARTRSHDSITSYTKVFDVKAKVGDLVFTDTSFKSNNLHSIEGYSLTPNDSSIASFYARTIHMIQVSDTVDSIQVFDSTNLQVFKRMKDSVDRHPITNMVVFPKGGLEFQVNSDFIAYNTSINGDTTIKLNFRKVTIKGNVTTNIPMLYLKSIDDMGILNGFNIRDSISNLTTGQSFEITVSQYYSLGALDNSRINNVKCVIYRYRIKTYWKNP